MLRRRKKTDKYILTIKYTSISETSNVKKLHFSLEKNVMKSWENNVLSELNRHHRDCFFLSQLFNTSLKAKVSLKILLLPEGQRNGDNSDNHVEQQLCARH